MKLKKALEDIFAEVKGRVTNNKRISFFIVVVIVALSLFLFLSVVVHNNRINSLKERYTAAIDAYNDEIRVYDDTVEKYNELISEYKRRGVVIPGVQIEREQEIDYDLESLYNNGDHDIDIVVAKTTELEAEERNLVSEINNTQILQYNDLIDSYNSEAEKYNSIAERLSEYRSIAASDKIIEKQETSSDNTSWNSFEMYFGDYDGLKKEIESIQLQYYSLCLNAYNIIIGDYNIVAEAYNEAVKKSSVDFINDLPSEVSLKPERTDDEIREMSEENLCNTIEITFQDTESVAEKYLTVIQITNPSELFIKERLKEVSNISGIAEVTKEHDPNGLLNKEGGYTSCVYFTVADIDISNIKGEDIVEKGTDGGGAIEVYETVEAALNRCDYLSQFDDTLLYSGSYAIVGTMVIRTSYMLTNKQQTDLTNQITKKLTELRQ